MAFNWETNGSNLALLPLDAKGRQSKAKIPLIYAHSDFVTDFQFSPFDDGLLATASQDLTVSFLNKCAHLKCLSCGYLNFFDVLYFAGLLYSAFFIVILIFNFQFSFASLKNFIFF
jgi:hypothetical protein